MASAEIITIGTEILLGEIVDTNSAYLARRLRDFNIDVFRTATIGDNTERIAGIIRETLERTQIIITTGGLGPTVDDRTRQAFAQAVGRPLVFDEDLLAQIEERFYRWGRVMSGNNRQQAYRPEGSIPIENPVGTAPCFSVEQDGHVAICLPGVPREMEYLLDNAVLPFLRERFTLTGIIKSRALKVSGAGESLVDERVGDLEKLENPSVGLNAHSGVVVIRITASADSVEAADRLIAPVESSVRERLGHLVFGTDTDTLEGVVLAELARRGERLAVVETGTGGRLGGKLADAGAGAFVGGRILALAEEVDWVGLVRETARQTQADWGLACALFLADGGMRLGVGVWSEGFAEHWQRGFGGHPALAAEWSSNLALDALRQILWRLSTGEKNHS